MASLVRKLAAVSILVPLCATVFLTAPTNAASRHALLIGISQYDAYNSSGIFPNIQCDEDIRRIQTTLMTRFQFDKASSDIIVCNSPQTCTHDAILAAFQKLVDETGPGDLVYIHYSGHGSQVPDPTKPDGLEETIVPSDYRDDQSNEIKGTQIRAFLIALAKKNPAQITLTFDSCHSGTISRGAGLPNRGIGYDEYVADYKTVHGEPPPNYDVYTNWLANHGSPPSGSGLKSDLDAGVLKKAHYVVLSACDDDQEAGELSDNGVPVGRLSYFLTKIYAEASPTATYDQVYDQLREMFQNSAYADQRPQIDGDGSSLLLGGDADPVPGSIQVFDKSGQYLLDAGELQGMTPNSVFAVYDATKGAFTDKSKIATATIVTTQLAQSTLSLVPAAGSALAAQEFRDARAVETAHNYQNSLLTLDPATVRQCAPSQADEILSRLNQDPKFVSTNLAPGAKPDVVMATDPGKGDLFLERGSGGYPFATLQPGEQLPDQVYAALVSEARYHYALVLGNTDPSANASVTMRLVPAQTPTGNYRDGYWTFSGDRDGDSGSLKVGDYFTVEVKNVGNQEVHIAILDLTSDGSVQVLWPDSDYHGQDNVIPPGATRRLWNENNTTETMVLKCSTPDSHEVYKLIATVDYANVAAMQNSVTGARGAEDPFQDLIGPAVNAVSRGAIRTAVAVMPSNWGTFTLPFSVSP